MTHLNLLEDELQQRPTNALGPVRAAMREFTKGAWSMPEGALGRIVTGAGDLPEYLLNVSLRTRDDEWIGCPDGYFPSCGVAAQVHSKEFHDGADEAGKDRWSATVEKDGAYAEHGVVVVPITPTSIDRRPDQVLTRLRRTIAANQGRDVSHIVVDHPLWQAERPGA